MIKTVNPITASINAPKLLNADTFTLRTYAPSPSAVILTERAEANIINPAMVNTEDIMKNLTPYAIAFPHFTFPTVYSSLGHSSIKNRGLGRIVFPK